MELGPDIVNVAELASRLGAHRSTEELREAHQAPGIHFTSLAARSSPRPSRSSGAVSLSVTTDDTSSTSAPRHVHGVARQRGRETAEQAAPAPGVAADEDLRHLRRAVRETGELQVVDVAAVAPVAIDELMVEHAQAEVDLDHPVPPFVRSINGIADTAITRIRMKYTMPSTFESAPVAVAAHVHRVVGDEEDREKRERQRDHGEDDRVLRDLHRVVPRHHDAERQHEHHDPREGEARRLARPLALAPLPAEELRDVVRAGEARLDRGAADGEQDADEREDQPDLAEHRLDAECGRAEKLRIDSARQEDHRRQDHQRERQERAEAVADHRGDLVHPEVLRPPAVLHRARRVEVDLVRRERRTEQADDEVEVHEPVGGRQARHEAVGDGAPVRMRLDRRDRDDEQAETAVAEHPLDPLEGQRPGEHEQPDHREQDQEAVGEAREQLQHDRDAADLGRAGQEVHDLRRDQRPEARAEADPLAHEVEDGTLRDGGHPSAHLRVHDDPDDADDDDPQQLEAERGSCLGVEDEVADVDEPADRRHDPERDLEELLHRRFPSRSALAAARSRRRASRRCVSRSEPECESRSRSAVVRRARAARVRASVVCPLARTASEARAAFVSSAAWTRTNVDVERPRAASDARSPPSAASDWRPAACCFRACFPGALCPPQPASSSAPVSAAVPTRCERLRLVRRRARR